MAELCMTPKPKNDPLLVEPSNVAITVGNGSADAKRSGSSGGSSVGTLAWLTFTTAMAIAGLIMAAWATWKVQQVDKHLPSVVLVDSPGQAADHGFNLMGNVYRGTGYWSTVPKTMAHPRSDHGAASYGGYIYVFGGQSHSQANNSVALVLGNMTRYNMYLGTVEEMPDMPEKRYRFGYGVVKNKLYVFGGWTGIEGVDSTAELAASTMVFNLDTSVWDPLTASSPRMTVPRADIAGAATDSLVYALGGYDTSTSNYNSITTAEVFDPTTGQWKRIADMNVPKGDLCAAAVGNVIYAMGGISTVGAGNCGDNGGDWFACHPWSSAVESYDAQSNKWVTRANMTKARGDFAVEVLPSGNILAVGGESSYGKTKSNQVAQPWVEEYITKLNVWVPKAPLFEPRFRFDMATDGNFIYAFGGAPTCDDYDPDATCNKQALSSIVGYFDESYPNIWAAST